MARLILFFSSCYLINCHSLEAQLIQTDSDVFLTGTSINGVSSLGVIEEENLGIYAIRLCELNGKAVSTNLFEAQDPTFEFDIRIPDFLDSDIYYLRISSYPSDHTVLSKPLIILNSNTKNSFKQITQQLSHEEFFIQDTVTIDS
ncbi:MAG: hypothetical protein AAFY41_09045, partial [Bacteroidota bacterium]